MWLFACIGTISPSISSKVAAGERIPASCMRRISLTVKARRSKPSAARVTACMAASSPHALQRAANLLDVVALDDVALGHLLVVLERHAAFLAGLDDRHLVLEALERRQLALVHHDIVADEPHMRAALHNAVGDAAAGDLTDLGDAENLQNLRIAEHGFAQ